MDPSTDMMDSFNKYNQNAKKKLTYAEYVKMMQDKENKDQQASTFSRNQAIQRRLGVG